MTTSLKSCTCPLLNTIETAKPGNVNILTVTSIRLPHGGHGQSSTVPSAIPISADLVYRFGR
jgi:hypothetical protein